MLNTTVVGSEPELDYENWDSLKKEISPKKSSFYRRNSGMFDFDVYHGNTYLPLETKKKFENQLKKKFKLYSTTTDDDLLKDAGLTIVGELENGTVYIKDNNPYSVVKARKVEQPDGRISYQVKDVLTHKKKAREYFKKVSRNKRMESFEEVRQSTVGLLADLFRSQYPSFPFDRHVNVSEESASNEDFKKLRKSDMELLGRIKNMWESVRSTQANYNTIDDLAE